MSTPHNSANKGDIARIVLMPGDPLRAKYIADTYLSDVTCFNEVRGMYGFTGTYKGERVSVMGSGMGIPSIGIYSYELFNFLDVDNIIRIGTAGGLGGGVKLRDVVIGMGACTNSAYAKQYNLAGTFAPIASWNLLKEAVEIGEAQGVNVRVGNILSSDTFYGDDETANDGWKKMGVLAIEMESAALYMNAARAGKNALGIFTISDVIGESEQLSAQERQTSLNQMMEIALEVAARNS